jgi:hypothetical protein
MQYKTKPGPLLNASLSPKDSHLSDLKAEKLKQDSRHPLIDFLSYG